MGSRVQQIPKEAVIGLKKSTICQDAQIEGVFAIFPSFKALLRRTPWNPINCLESSIHDKFDAKVLIHSKVLRHRLGLQQADPQSKLTTIPSSSVLNVLPNVHEYVLSDNPSR